MPKKACCCGSNYIAIPCRFAQRVKFGNGIAEWAHYRNGSPTPQGGFGGGQFDLVGPFRFIGGERVFDTTREIIYMIRGAGGGASGVTSNFSYGFGVGGNGAYIEYKKNASLDDVVKSGAGGCGAWNNISYNSMLEKYQNGGEAFAWMGDGGGASVIGNGTNWFINPIAVAGGGGGAGYYIEQYPQTIQYIGGKYGGHAGVTNGQDGQAGIYYEFYQQNPPPPGLCGAGGGGTQTIGGTGGGGSILYPAKRGTKDSGGMGSTRPLGANAPKGFGGGGGGGLFGGGGAAWDGGGGGGSSTLVPNRLQYAFEPKNNLSANYCNPYLNNNSGVGGRQLPLVSSINGQNGQVIQYYIYGECECDPDKNNIPDPLFICFNENQYTQYIESLGPPPATSGLYDPIFTVNNEDYIFVGVCDSACEQIYQLSPDTVITDARWSLYRPIDDGELGTIITPSCCSQIVCTPICPLSGVNCADCGCDPFSEVFVCCDTKGKPDQYLSVYNGWIYSCSKSNNSWIIPGQVTETVTQQCLDPIDGPEPICTQPSPESCTKTVDIPYTDCHPNYPENCQFSVNVQGPTVHYDTRGPVGSSCYFHPQSYAIQGVIPLNASFGGFKDVSNPDPTDLCNPPANLYYYRLQLDIFWNSAPELVQETELFSITYDCVPTIEPNIGGAGGIWKICDAEVNVIQGPLSNIIMEFNSLLGGRVSLTDLSGGNYYVGGRMPDRITSIVRTISDGKATYTVKATHTYYVPCGSLFYSGLQSFVPPFSPQDGRRDARRATGAAIDGAQHDSWKTLSALNISVCPCTITSDSFDPRFGFTTTTCPTSPPCFSGTSETVEDPYCSEMTVS
jgi:hypothetical protein